MVPAFGDAIGESAGRSETTLAHSANIENEKSDQTTAALSHADDDEDGGLRGWMAVLGWYVQISQKYYTLISYLSLRLL